MAGSIPGVSGGVVSQINEFYEFIRFLNNKDEVAVLVERIKAATDENAKQSKAADEAKKVADERIAQADLRDKTVTKREEDAKAVATQQQRANADLAKREAAVVEALSRLDAEKRAFEAAKKTYESQRVAVAAEFAAHQAAAQKELDAKATALADRERNVALRETAAQALSTEYARKLDALKKITG